MKKKHYFTKDISIKAFYSFGNNCLYFIRKEINLEKEELNGLKKKVKLSNFNFYLVLSVLLNIFHAVYPVSLLPLKESFFRLF